MFPSFSLTTMTSLSSEDAAAADLFSPAFCSELSAEDGLEEELEEALDMSRAEDGRCAPSFFTWGDPAPPLSRAARSPPGKDTLLLAPGLAPGNDWLCTELERMGEREVSRWRAEISPLDAVDDCERDLLSPFISLSLRSRSRCFLSRSSLARFSSPSRLLLSAGLSKEFSDLSAHWLPAADEVGWAKGVPGGRTRAEKGSGAGGPPGRGAPRSDPRPPNGVAVEPNFVKGDRGSAKERVVKLTTHV